MNTNDPSIEELLSASLDDELSADQQQVVEQYLREKPSAQETIDAYRELSVLVQSIPRSQAPDKLSIAVMERVTLVANPPTIESKSPRRAWKWWSTSLLATAAAAMAMVWFSRPPQDATELAMSTDHSNRPNPMDMDSWYEVDHMAMTDRDIGETPGSAIPEGARIGSISKSVRKTARADRPAMPSAPSIASFSADKLDLNHRVAPLAGEVFGYLEKQGDEIVVVELMVVSVEKTASEMIVLLRQLGVQDIDVPRSGQTEDLVAVYVEADERQLANMLDQLTHQVAIVDAEPYRAPRTQPPAAVKKVIDMKVASAMTSPKRPSTGTNAFDGKNARRMQQADAPAIAQPERKGSLVKPADNTKPSRPPQPALADRAGRTPKAPRTAAKPLPDSQPLPSPSESAAEGSASSRSRAWLARIGLPREELKRMKDPKQSERNKAKLLSKERSAHHENQSAVRGSQDKQDNLTSRSSTPEKTRRVLFVIQPQPAKEN